MHTVGGNPGSCHVRRCAIISEEGAGELIRIAAFTGLIGF